MAIEKDWTEPRIINGGLHVDDRGKVSFINDMPEVKRFYVIENLGKDIIRAFHGHKKEDKYFYVVQGTALICANRIDADRNSIVHRFVLSEHQPQLLHIPHKFANGVKSLEDKTKVIVFSTATLEESKSDDERIPYDYWGIRVWRSENR